MPVTYFIPSFNIAFLNFFSPRLDFLVDSFSSWWWWSWSWSCSWSWGWSWSCSCSSWFSYSYFISTYSFFTSSDYSTAVFYSVSVILFFFQLLFKNSSFFFKKICFYFFFQLLFKFFEKVKKLENFKLL